jgi:hypothetical protein
VGTPLLANAATILARLLGVGRRAPDSHREMAAAEQPISAESHACLPERRWRTVLRSVENVGNVRSEIGPSCNVEAGGMRFSLWRIRIVLGRTSSSWIAARLDAPSTYWLLAGAHEFRHEIVRRLRPPSIRKQRINPGAHIGGKLTIK